MIRSHRFSLFEVMVYIIVFMLVTNLSLLLYHAGVKNQGRLAVAADDISRVSGAGDAWRKLVRNAQTVNLENDVLIVHDGTTQSKFSVSENSFVRSIDGKPHVLLERVASCRFDKEIHDGFIVWTMTIRLQTRAEKPTVDPAFTFISTHSEGGTVP